MSEKEKALERIRLTQELNKTLEKMGLQEFLKVEVTPSPDKGGEVEEPNSGGNRPYDYISVEEHDAAEKILEEREHWSGITLNEIVVLRYEASQRYLNKDIVDRVDRLALVRCIFSHIDCQRSWLDRAHELEKEVDSLKAENEKLKRIIKENDFYFDESQKELHAEISYYCDGLRKMLKEENGGDKSWQEIVQDLLRGR